jgi:hypothetical protein
MRIIRILLFLLLPVFASAHPGGGLIALDADTVIFGDPMNNVLWRMEKGKKPQALITGLHVHWTTLGLDGRLYSESFQEMGGGLFRTDLLGGGKVKLAEEKDLNALVFAIGKSGEIIFQKGERIMERHSNGTVKPFRGKGMAPIGDPKLEEVIAYYWTPDGALYLSDGNRLRRVGADGIIRLVARVEGRLLERQIWNSTGSPRIWSIAVDPRKRVYTALPDLGHVVRIDLNGSQHVIDRASPGWRVTAVATHGDSVFLLESPDATNDGQRVRVIYGSDPAVLFGQVGS